MAAASLQAAAAAAIGSQGMQPARRDHGLPPWRADLTRPRLARPRALKPLSRQLKLWTRLRPVPACSRTSARSGVAPAAARKVCRTAGHAVRPGWDTSGPHTSGPSGPLPNTRHLTAKAMSAAAPRRPMFSCRSSGGPLPGRPKLRRPLQAGSLDCGGESAGPLRCARCAAVGQHAQRGCVRPLQLDASRRWMPGCLGRSIPRRADFLRLLRSPSSLLDLLLASTCSWEERAARRNAGAQAVSGICISEVVCRTARRAMCP